MFLNGNVLMKQTKNDNISSGAHFRQSYGDDWVVASLAKIS